MEVQTGGEAAGEAQQLSTGANPSWVGGRVTRRPREESITVWLLYPGGPLCSRRSTSGKPGEAQLSA